MNYKLAILSTIGFSCHRWRVKQKIKLKNMAIMANTTEGHLALFEKGCCDSFDIFATYVSYGFDIEKDIVVNYPLFWSQMTHPMEFHLGSIDDLYRLLRLHFKENKIEDKEKNSIWQSIPNI